MSGSRKAGLQDGSGAGGADSKATPSRKVVSNGPSSFSGATSSANQPGNSTTLAGTGAAISSTNYSQQASSQIPMAEPTAEINRSERVYQAEAPPARKKTTVGGHKRGGTLDSRLDYAVSAAAPLTGPSLCSAKRSA